MTKTLQRIQKTIAPSLLASNQARFGSEAKRAERSGADRLHLDVMDGHFVPNISFGPQVVKAIRPLTKLLLDIHLMCSKPEILLEAFAQAGADEMIIHVELNEQVPALIGKIKALGKKVGLALNPLTSFSAVQPFLDQVDLLLVMTVNPGFGGQEFIRETVPKSNKLRHADEENGCPTASAWMAVLLRRAPLNALGRERTRLSQEQAYLARAT